MITIDTMYYVIERTPRGHEIDHIGMGHRTACGQIIGESWHTTATIPVEICAACEIAHMRSVARRQRGD